MRTDLLNEAKGLQVRSLSKSLTVQMQKTAEKFWLDEALAAEQKRQRSQGKLGKIEEHLDEIVTDVKQNLTSLFSRGMQFDELTEKSENLKTHVSS